MPWWIWLILALFMLAMLVAGIVYAAVHALRASKVVGAVAADVSARIDEMNAPQDAGGAPRRAIFTEPLAVAADRYADAQVAVVERRERRHERHAAVWRRWEQFND